MVISHFSSSGIFKIETEHTLIGWIIQCSDDVENKALKQRTSCRPGEGEVECKRPQTIESNQIRLLNPWPFNGHIRISVAGKIRSQVESAFNLG